MTFVLPPWDLNFTAPDGLVGEYDSLDETLTFRFVNHGSEPVRPGIVVCEARLDSPATGGWAWVHGRYMQQDAFVRVFGGPELEGYEGSRVTRTKDAVSYISQDLLAVALPSRPLPVLLLGALEGGAFFVDMEVRLDHAEGRLLSLRLSIDLEATEVAPGDSLSLPTILVLEGSDPRPLVDRYALEVGNRSAARIGRSAPSGWCSWYQFGNAVTEADVLRNAEALRAGGWPLDVVQVDDGFQRMTGDWLEAKDTFPSGMAALAERIRAGGHSPGLWLAPFVLHESSSAVRDHPDLTLKNLDGSVYFVDTWLGRCAVPDLTHPAAEAWLRNVVRTVTADWGFSYLKLDALAYAAVPSTVVTYHAAGTTAAAHIRRGLEIIREAAGEETFLLGCTCHFLPAVGLVDAMRVGPDVRDVWADGAKPSVRHAMRMALQRGWMHARWWLNDPDCLIVRDRNTGLSPEETRFLAAAIALTGGLVVSSDDIASVSTERREMAFRLTPPTGAAAVPGSPGDGPVPSVWRAELDDNRWLVGILNWTDASRWVVVQEHLRAGEVAFDVWSGHPVGMGDVLLRPHEAALWQVSGPGKTPRLVGDTGNVGFAGLTGRHVSGRLQLTNASGRPRVVAIQSRGAVYEADLEPGESRWFD